MKKGLGVSILTALAVIILGSMYLLIFVDKDTFPTEKKPGMEASAGADGNKEEGDENAPSVTPELTATPEPTQAADPRQTAMDNFLAKPQATGNKVLMDVEYISQEPDYPTGCESVSAVMLLNYMGANCTVDTFVDTYLEKGNIIPGNGTYYAPDPNVKFIGDPRGQGFGCYAPVIVSALEKAAPGHYVLNETGKEFSELVDTYIKRQTPVMVWATMDMKEPRTGESWIIDNSIVLGKESEFNLAEKPKKDDPGVETVTWVAGEHCLVLVGYDDENYYLADPYKSHGIKAYKKDVVEQRYKDLNMQAVAMIPKQ